MKDVKELFKVKFVIPEDRDSHKQALKSIRRKLERAGIPEEIEISLSDRSQNDLARDIIVAADHLKMAANFFNLKAEDFKSQFDFSMSDHEVNCHTFNLVQNILDLSFKKRSQALVPAEVDDIFMEEDDDSRFVQILVIAEFKNGDKVTLSKDGATVKASFDGILGRKLDMNERDSTGHSVKVCPLVEMFPLDKVTFLN